MTAIYNVRRNNAKSAILIDIKKAYDSVDIDVLREKINNTMQTREAEYLVSYLEIYRSLSLCLLQTDIKQNRVLSQGASNNPKFFNFYINDILENINNTDMNYPKRFC
jgi:D-alanyl-D-alanine dipeptidase